MGALCCTDRRDNDKFDLPAAQLASQSDEAAAAPLEGDHGGVMIQRLKPNGKPNKEFYTFKDLDGHTLIKRPGELDGGSFFIKDLKNCAVYILDHTA